VQADDQAGKGDLVGIEDNTKRGLFSPQKTKARPDAFAINDRDAVLTNLTAAPLAGPPRGARELPSYTFPQIMRSHYVRHLLRLFACVLRDSSLSVLKASLFRRLSRWPDT
jgi:hypothetical protein